MDEVRHRAAVQRKSSGMEIDGSEATITLSPAVLEAMQNLHARAIIHGQEKFDGDVAEILKSMAYGKPLSVEQTLSSLVTVSAEAGECYGKTGDWEVANALKGCDPP